MSKQKEVPFIKGIVNVQCLLLTEFTCRAGMGGEASGTDWGRKWLVPRLQGMGREPCKVAWPHDRVSKSKRDKMGRGAEAGSPQVGRAEAGGV